MARAHCESCRSPYLRPQARRKRRQRRQPGALSGGRSLFGRAPQGWREPAFCACGCAGGDAQMLVATARRFGALELLVLIKEALGACSRSVANLVLGVALFGVRQERGPRADAQRRGWVCRCCPRYPAEGSRRSRGSANARGCPVSRALAEPWGVRQPAAAAGAGSPLRAVTEWSWLSREEISTAARIAPATARPAPTRNARS